MNLTAKDKEKLRALARGTKGTFLIEYFNKLKDHIADIRTPLTVSPEIDRDVRMELCILIDELLIQKFKVLADETIPPEDDYR